MTGRRPEQMPAKSFAIPAGAQSIDQILAEARSHLQRVNPQQLFDEIQHRNRSWGSTNIIDIRPAAQRQAEGDFKLPHPTVGTKIDSHDGLWIPPEHEVHVIERNVLEWRLDPQSGSRLKDIVDTYGYDTRLVIICSEGYTSSLAACELQRLGLRHATDLIGGHKAWKSSLKQFGEEYKI